jgi:DNA-directed RNA polymerase specialized sigma24 family protein
MKKIKYYDNTKSSLKTFIPMIIISCAKTCITKANGQSKNYNKLEYVNNTFNIDDLIVSEDNNKLNSIVCNTIDNTYNNILINEILSLNNLSDRQKLIIKLMSNGLNFVEISIILKCSRQNIQMTFQRAKEKIVNNYND